MLGKLRQLTFSFLILVSFSVLGNAKTPPKDLQISEVFAAGHLTAVDGLTCDWIELYNGSDQILDLTGYGISNRISVPYRSKLSGHLMPGEYLVLTPDKGLGFSLGREGEHLVLTSPTGKTIEEIIYKDLPYDVSLVKQGKESYQTWSPTPGTGNILSSRDEAEQKYYESASKQSIIISEVMAANGEFAQGIPNYDWVELYNPGDKTVSLEGMYLSWNAGNLTQWSFPRLAALGAGKRLVVYCTGEKVKLSIRSVMVNDAFKIDKSNGAIILSDGKQIIDCVSLGSQYGNISYGRPEGKGFFRFLNQSTFNKPNPKEGSLNRADPVSFSVAGGYKSKQFSLTLSAHLNFGIRYSLDGSEPTFSSPIYVSPLTIDKSTVVRAFAFQEGWIDGPLTTKTYLFDVPLRYPIISISGDTDIFFGSNGIFEPENENNAAQQRINMEIFDQQHTPVNHQVTIRLTGGTSQVFVPRTFTVYARPGLGTNSIDYNPFLDRSYSQYSALTLRHGGTDAMRTRLRDGFLTRLARGYKLMYQACTPAAVYLNGEFWGAFNLRERINQDSIAQWEGITDKEIIEQIIIVKNRGIRIKGSKDELDQLASFCRSNDLNIPENLNHVLDLLDVDSLFAHTAFEIISGNNDLSNVRYYKIPGGKWKLILFDLDLAMMNSNPPPLDFFLGNGRYATKFCYGELFTSLMQVPVMREKFFMLTGRILRERFVPQEILKELDLWKAEYTSLIFRHAQKWQNFSFISWEKSMDQFGGVLVKRPSLVVKYVQKAYGLTDEEMNRFFGEFIMASSMQQTAQ